MGGFASHRRLSAVLVLLVTAVAGLHAPADAAPRKAHGHRVVTLPFEAVALNDKGVVVGNAGSRAVTWKHGRLRVLPLPAGATESTATDVNNRGVVGGSVLVPGSGRHAVVWVKGHPRRLPESEPWDESSESYVQALNDAGEAIGANDFGFGWFVTGWRSVETGTPTASWAGGKSNPRAFNDDGIAVGTDASHMHAERWSMFGAPTAPLAQLDPDGEAWSFAYDVNDKGQAVGIENDERSDGFVVSPVLWEADGTARALPAPADGTILATEIDDRGRVAGSWTSPEGREEVVVWTGRTLRRTGLAGSPVDLNDKGSMLVRDGSRSLLVSLRGGRGVRTAHARDARPSYARELRIARQEAARPIS